MNRNICISEMVIRVKRQGAAENIYMNKKDDLFLTPQITCVQTH